MDRHEVVRTRAYALWEKSGKVGDLEDHIRRAEHDVAREEAGEIVDIGHDQSSSPVATTAPPERPRIAPS